MKMDMEELAILPDCEWPVELELQHHDWERSWSANQGYFQVYIWLSDFTFGREAKYGKCPLQSFSTVFAVSRLFYILNWKA